MSAAHRILHVLTGCTAVGKTELALGWAEEHGAEIISCDSLLFYRGMDIGTAKPSAAELARVPHHLIDLMPVSEQMDISRYVGLARAAAEDIAGRGRPVLVTGGSGFYLKSFLAPVVDDIEVDPGLRRLVDAMSREEALERLRALNPGGLGNLDTANPRRVARALERCMASGMDLAGLAQRFAALRPAFHDWSIRIARLDRDPDDLNRRIVLRVQAMLDSGLVEEVRHLLDQGLKSNPSAAAAIGYRETIEVIEGRKPAAGLAEAIAQGTRGLVKKQRTWFRTQLPPHQVIHPGRESRLVFAS